MIVSIAIARGLNGEIGVNGQLPWRLSGDLKNFKKVTMGKPILMGRKTFDSIGRPLPGRENIVLTRDEGWKREGVSVFHSLEDVFRHFENEGTEELVIIGGENILRQTMDRVSVMHLTEVRGSFPDADAFMPEYNPEEWETVENFIHPKDDKNEYSWEFKTLVKKEV